MEVYIGIPCYKVANSIEGVLKRLKTVRAGLHVILVNDGSPDNLDEVVKSLDTSAFASFTYKVHEKNKGYGGAQKTLFETFRTLAKDQRDILILVHGDGQTAEDEVAHFVRTAEEHPHLDAILGSRMLNPWWVQLAAGRPLYKVVSDYLLTRIENWVYNLKLSTYASGYRAYTKKGLDKIDFTGTSNAHTFDGESLILFRFFDVKYKEIRVRVVQNDTGFSANHIGEYARNTIALMFKYGFAWKRRAKRFLIVNADDYGYARSINDAVERAFEEGAITNATLIPNDTGFDDAVARAKARGYLEGLGIHINVTQGVPLGSGYRTITGKDGRFIGITRLIVKSIFGGLDKNELLAEMRLQVAKCRAAGVPTTHLDSHQWAQVLPEVWWALSSVAHEYRVLSVRGIREDIRPGFIVGASPRSILNSFVIALLRLRIPRSEGLYQVPEHYYGIVLSGHGRLTDALVALARTLPPGVSELMCHIGSEGYADLEGKSYYAEGRQRELEALSSPAFKKALSDANVSMISYKEFAEL